MSCDAGLAERIPWYVNGALPTGERVRLERHLALCEDCRSLVEQARGQLRLAAAGPLEQRQEHLHPAVLVAWVEEPETFDASAREWVEGRLASCGTCREALESLRRVDDALSAAEPVTAPGARIPSLLLSFWDLLQSTLLRPVPALVYLLILIAIPAVWLDMPGDDADRAPLATARILEWSSERSLRDVPGGSTPSPVIVESARDPEERVSVRLLTDLTIEDIERYPLVLEIRRAGDLVWSRRCEAVDFAVDGERASFPVLLRPAALAPGEYEIALVVDAPGDPADEQALFRRTFRIRGKGDR